MERKDRSPRRIYSWVTQQIVAAVAAGAPRFEMPWHRASGGLARPINATTGHAYRFAAYSST